MNKELVNLYKSTSKHSSYQILPPELDDLIGEEVDQSISRYEKERMDFLVKNIDFKGKKVLDIGGNTGYFSFEALKNNAVEVCYIEGNKEHYQFVKKAAELLDKNIKAENHYLEFKGDLPYSPYDIVLFFNVVHHLGDDFGNQNNSKEEAKKEMKEAINYFSNKTDILVFQMGFCWKGNRDLLIFEDGTKAEMIDFVKSAIGDNWTIESIGIAEQNGNTTSYLPLNDKNINRNDNLGEFRNRPIFILKSNINRS